MDLGIEVLLELFSRNGLIQLFKVAEKNASYSSDNAKRIYSLKEEYFKTIDIVISFLQGKSPTLARQICTQNYLPEAARFGALEELDWAFGAMGMQDKAKHLATLYLEDISDFIIECVDENFGFSRYAESIGQSANSFDPLYQKLQEKQTYIDLITLQLLEKRILEIQPKMIAFSVPFPGNLYSAFRCAQYIKERFPKIITTMGGGFPNTELRDLNDPRVFEFFDYITLDDGELPIELLINHIHTPAKEKPNFKRTFLIENENVVYNNSCTKLDYKQKDVGTPDYSDLQLDKYISVIEIANPMHSLWSDGRWNKLTMAHGCYWGKCSFCDVTLDYIKIYEPVAASQLVDRMEQMIAQTGETGFHFVDEAAPPALMKAVALEILKRNLTVTWWTNIRFEKSFTQDLCFLLQASGCIAVSGGLEVASDRLLKLIEKGVSVAQVAKVTHNFTNAGIMVHSYLMYGYPTQTVQETMDSLEMVRQLFELGIIQSGFWHQFSLTTHSPIGKKPEEYDITPIYKNISFANNDVLFKDKTGIKHEKFSYGLKKSIFNYMHGIGLDLPINEWFDFKVPNTKIEPNFIENCLQETHSFSTKTNAKIVWIGVVPEIETITKTKRDNSWKMTKLHFHSKSSYLELTFEKAQGEWLHNTLNQIKNNPLSFQKIKTDFEEDLENFELFWYSKQLLKLKEYGLLIL